MKEQRFIVDSLSRRRKISLIVVYIVSGRVRQVISYIKD